MKKQITENDIRLFLKRKRDVPTEPIPYYYDNSGSIEKETYDEFFKELDKILNPTKLEKAMK